MSLAINIDKVSRVLLSDGWHDVLDESFTLDAYEYLWFPNEDTTSRDVEIVHGGGQSGVCSKGFTFKSIRVSDSIVGHPDDRPIWMHGPLTAIQAVETRE